MADRTPTADESEDQELLDLLLAEHPVETGPQLVRREPGAPPVLSYAQQRMWVLQNLDPASGAYNIAAAVRLEGSLDCERLEAALNDVVARHEGLRTEFVATEGGVAARLVAEAKLAMESRDFREWPADSRRDEASRWLGELAARPFDLSRAPLLRLSVARLGESQYHVGLTMHHIVSDGWSMDVLVRELGAAYASRSMGGRAEWPELSVQYADFAAWQRLRLDHGLRAIQLDYWKRQLAQPAVLSLPSDRARPAWAEFSGAAHVFSLPAELVAGIGRLAREEDATVFVVLLAAWQTLLHRLSDQDDVVVGAPVSNRTRSELEPLIGLFVNTLVLRADFSDRPHFREVVSRTRQTLLDALAHQDIPFEELVGELQPQRDPSRHPLFQVMFSVLPATRETLQMPGLTLESLPAPTTTAKFDLMLALEEGPAGIGGAIEYRSALFEPATIRRWAEMFVHLLAEIVRNPASPVAELDLLSTTESGRMLEEWNATERAYPERTLGELFTATARAEPETIAVRFGANALNYAELDAQSNRVAHALISAGVRPDTPVPVLLERSLELIVALLGVLKAGGAYVALEPELPPARLALLLDEVCGPVILTQNKFADKLPVSAGSARCLCLDGAAATFAAQSDETPEVAIVPDHLAYISYTSGSTGRPKGVCVPHRAIVRLLFSTDYAEFGPSENFLQLAPVAFDASTLELWAPLLHGGRLVVAPPGPLSVEEIGRLLREEKITTLWLTAGLFQLMVDERLGDLGGLRQLLAGGDVLSVPHVRRVLAAHPHLRLVNGYGPTENTTFTCCHTIATSDLALTSIPIGRPIGNTQVYVLDARLRLVPVGVPGELCTGGAGLARGYLANPVLTAEKFIANPFGPGRLYRTGDRVRWRPDGTIEFLGRIDGQLKLRGFRIEPGEIESALLGVTGVKTAAVHVQAVTGRKQLIGYVTGAVDGMAVRAQLQTRLPDYLVPAAVVVLAALPLNANGKLDRAALPLPDFSAARAPETFAAPCDEREREVAAVWAAVLGLPQVGVHDSYFALGGDSISAIQVASRLKRAGWRVEVRDLFQYPTVAELAARLQRLAGSKPAEEAVVGPVGLTPAQAWFFARHDAERHHFNQALQLRARERLEPTHAAAVVQALWSGHDALRTVFAVEGASVAAEILAPHPAPIFEFVDLSDFGDAEARRLEHADRVQRSFDLGRGPLFKAVLYRLPTGDRLLLSAHHLVVDGVSWRILLEDLEVGLRQLSRGEALEFGPRSDSIRRWTQAAATLADDPALDAELEWWNSVQGAEATTESPGTFGEARTISAWLDETLTQRLLREAHRAYHTEINDLLLVALARVLRPAGQSPLYLTLEGHGREDLGDNLALERTVGWFTSLFPVMVPATGELDCQIKETKELLRAVPRKGAGWGIRTFLGAASRRPVVARPRVSFNYLGQFGEESGGWLAFADEPTGAPIGAGVARQHELDFGALVARGRMELTLMFAPARCTGTEAEQLLARWRDELAAVVKHCCDRADSEKTPADFTSRGLALAEYEKLLRTRGWKAAAVEDLCRATPMQAGLLFESQFESESRAYFVQVALGLRGKIDVAAWNAAWRDLSERNSVLRTTITHEGLAAPWQVVWKNLPPETVYLDLRGLDRTAQERRVAEWRATDLARGFDLERGPLLRVALMQWDDRVFRAVWSFHHVLLDGWSLGILQRDLRECYAARLTGRAPESAPAPAFREFVRWLESRDVTAARQFWSGYLAGYERTASVPRSSSGAESAVDFGGRLERDLGSQLSAAVRTLAAGAGVTLATVFQCAWGVVLARYNRTDDIVFGGIVAGRPAEVEGVEDMMGLFICAVPVRVRPRSRTSFAELLREVQAAARTAEIHHHLPAVDVQAQTPLGRSLFDHLVTIENYPLGREASACPADDWMIAEVEAHDRTHYDFDLTVNPGESTLLRFQFNRRLFSDRWVAAIADHVLAVLTQAAAEPQRPLGRMMLSTEPALRGPLREWQGPGRAEFRSGPWVHEMIATRALSMPTAVAVEAGAAKLSYAELDRRANQLAHWLRERGIGPETLVGVALERKPELIVALLAIWRAGGAYLPLDRRQPAARVADMVADGGVKLVIGERASLALPEVEQVALTSLSLGALPITAPDVAITGENLAYVIFTSGSTGRPKGSAITHAGLRNYVNWSVDYYGVEPGQVAPLHTTIGFDLTVTSLWVPLAAGGRVRLVPEESDLSDAVRGADPMDRLRPVKLTPAHLDLLDAAGLSGRRGVEVLVVGGEQLYSRQVAPWVRAGARVVNEYGPTETVVGCTVREAVPADLDAAIICIGRPIANVTNYALDADLNPVPIGVAGELFIGGAQVARGYLGRPDLTAERFLPDPFATGAGARMYRTGDLVRWRDDGQLEYLGRIDEQVKLRGYRIELGEIEGALSACADVQACAAAVVGDRIVGYVAVRDGATPVTEVWRESLRARLPDYMVPSDFVILPSLPLTANGKVNRRALPKPERMDRAARIAPRNEVEEALAAIWREVLQVAAVGIHDNFFDLGGHSLKAMQVVSRVQVRFGVKPELRPFFQQPTIAALAEMLGTARHEKAEAIPAAPLLEHYPLSFAQQRLWLLHHLGGKSAYNMPQAYVLSAELDPDALERAFQWLASRHEALRTAFIEIDGEPRQRVLTSVPFTLTRIDLSRDADREERARELADADAIAEFDLSRPPLLRATLIRLAPGRAIFLFTMHHIIGDGWSGNVLYRELFALYTAARNAAVDPLPPLRLHYKDFAVWQKARGFAADERYWLRRLAGVPEALALPYDFDPKAERDFRGDFEAGMIGPDVADRLRGLAKARRTTTSNVVLAVFKLVLFQLTKQEDFCVGVSVANRSRAELENLIGFFVNILPVRTRFSETMEFEELLAQVTTAADEAFEHQDYPFDLLVQKVNPARANNRQPLLNVVYGFQNFLDVHVEVGADAAASASTTAELAGTREFERTFRTSKFDLTLFVEDRTAGRALALTLEYDTGLFRPETVRRWLRLMERFAGMVAMHAPSG